MQSVLLSDFDQLAELIERVDAPHRGRVLDGQDGLLRRLHVLNFADVGFHCFGGHEQVGIAANGAGHHPRKPADAAILVGNEVALVAEQDLSSRGPRRHYCSLVREHTRNDEAGSFLAEQLCCHLLQFDYIEVFSVNVVCVVGI